MNTTNPYVPPQAAVADIGAGEYQEMKVWSWRGRLGRIRFLAYGAVAYLVFLPASIALGFIAGAAGAGTGSSGLFDVLFWALLLVYFVFIASVTIRRSHDMGWSGWMSLLALVPLVGLIWVFKAGTPEANKYGLPPPPNTTGLKFAAFGIFGGAMLLGILAAIALPAYQQYVQRAQSAQSPAK